MDYKKELAENCSSGIFEHFISLGHCCYVAIELEQMGLRDSSMPFDWNRTKWKAITRSFDTRFKGYLDFDQLYQKKSNPRAYKNLEYGVGFFHDFNEYEPLKRQYKKVVEKYNRRINRFFDDISEPTLFIRYCMDEEEVKEISCTYPAIEERIKKYNPNNEIVFISHDRITGDEISGIKYLFFIEKDPEEELNQRPISSSFELYEMLTNAPFSKKKLI